MKRTVKFVVVPFRLVKGHPRPSEMRPAMSEEGALRIAERLAEYYDGAAAYEVYLDEETGDMTEPRELAVYGQVQDLARDAA